MSSNMSIAGFCSPEFNISEYVFHVSFYSECFPKICPMAKVMIGIIIFQISIKSLLMFGTLYSELAKHHEFIAIISDRKIPMKKDRQIILYAIEFFCFSFFQEKTFRVHSINTLLFPIL